MRLQHCPLISALTSPYASAPPPHLLLGLQSLCRCGALKLCLQHFPHPPLRLLAPAAYHPYACGVPSRHASDVAYHPYACIVPARHASNTAYYPYARSALPTCLQRSLPSLNSWSAFLTCLRCRLPSLTLKYPPNLPPTPPHTGPILKAAYDPYAPAAPSR
ncbi:hypothetical protein O181_000994 [Austropuccinia psidii MF-1]|uniref:Uncharacterized protein n=1 Tax=Austropuccinia psidii MF-1 TaxID=1389203 RepID=A0A9Q3B9M7_9BASI|nr:hypothetical protein [Austropuccinia psidii MF-1]